MRTDWRTALLAGLSVLVASACEPRVSLGGACTSDATCGELRCLFGRCRAECGPGAACSDRLVCNDGVCASLDESCSAADPCEDPQLACAGTLCAPRCMAGDCEGSDVCEARVGGAVCVPAARASDAGELDAGGLDAGGLDDADPRDAGAVDAGAGARGEQRVCVGAEYACAIRGGRVYCWGWNNAGVLGNDTPAFESATRPTGPVRRAASAAVLEGAREITCGYFHACASDGDVVSCWGANDDGLLLGHAEGSLAGVSARGVAHVTAGTDHTCAFGGTGAVCWGANESEPGMLDGRLGHGDPSSATATRAFVFEAASELVAGAEVTCIEGLTAVECFGRNREGVTGSTTVGPARFGGPISGLDGPIDDLTAGTSYACAIVRGEVRCWGGDSLHTLGRGTTAASDCGGLACDPRAAPVALGPDVATLRFASLSRGALGGTVCAITEERRVVCWGENYFGAAGTDTWPAQPRPESLVRTSAGPLEDVRAVGCGRDTCCAIDGAERVWCWGGNGSGQLGNGMTDSDLVDAFGAPDGGSIDARLPHPIATEVDFSVAE